MTIDTIASDIEHFSCKQATLLRSIMSSAGEDVLNALHFEVQKIAISINNDSFPLIGLMEKLTTVAFFAVSLYDKLSQIDGIYL